MSDDETLYPEMDGDLKDLEISKLKEETAQLKKRVKDQSNETQKYSAALYRLQWSNRRAWSIALAIVVPILVAGLSFFLYGYQNFGGGPEARHQADIAKKEVERSHTWEANCDKAGGRIVGGGSSATDTMIYCIFSNGASINKAGRNS